MKPHPKKLLDQVRDLIRLKHYSIRTERAYVDWIRLFALFHHKRHPRAMGSEAGRMQRGISLLSVGT